MCEIQYNFRVYPLSIKRVFNITPIQQFQLVESAWRKPTFSAMVTMDCWFHDLQVVFVPFNVYYLLLICSELQYLHFIKSL